jgi:hypothetical protein
MTEYIVGLLMAIAIAACAAWTGLDRGRALYPTALIVIAFYYVLFAAMGAPTKTLVIESAVALAFSAVALVGFKKSTWLVAVGIAGHGVFDLFHHLLIHNPGMPLWWPGFCATIDIALGCWVGLRLLRNPLYSQS